MELNKRDAVAGILIWDSPSEFEPKIPTLILGAFKEFFSIKKSPPLAKFK